MLFEVEALRGMVPMMVVAGGIGGDNDLVSPQPTMPPRQAVDTSHGQVSKYGSTGVTS